MQVSYKRLFFFFCRGRVGSQERFFCRAKQGEWLTHAPKTQTLQRVSAKQFEMQGEGGVSQGM